MAFSPQRKQPAKEGKCELAPVVNAKALLPYSHLHGSSVHPEEWSAHDI